MIRLQNVTYLVRDHEEALRFFVDALGFVVRQDETAPSGRRRVVVGPDGDGAGFVLALSDDADRVGRQAGDDVAFFLETDDFAAQHARMLAHGVVFREQPRHEPYGTVAIFEDPCGAAWDLIQPPIA
ncbi:VOC family protein [Clavibacter lycopersici]|uniref:VOC family protein n=1 Tax=Clavibacter lycopersici TaxID=2301718 RepID=A0A399SWC4_9MICO|nr:VOC family protein [Clavibacter lycopersici]RIJ46521.1 VOC family protein [Clavibacter lycopersici]RIJ59084.1 VOC family protein [Clavibacter lycopersici]